MSRRTEQKYPELAKVLAISKLTLRSAFRYRLVGLLLPLLGALLIGLPYLIKHNGTAQMLTQVVLSYSLNCISILMGLITVWLSCGSLAKEIQENQMQMIAVKPIARWQIWLGKWLGITLLNAAVLFLSGAIVVGVLYSESQDLSVHQKSLLESKVLVARGGLTEPKPDLSEDIERIFQQRISRDNVAKIDHDYVREKVEEEVWAMNQLVKPNHLRQWKFDFGWRHRRVADQPLHLRVKFYAAQYDKDEHYPTLWIVGDPNTGMFWREELDLSPVTYHEIEIPSGLINADGILHVECRNYTASSIIFPVDEDLEVLFPEGSFLTNFARGLLVLLLWLALLAACGLSAASILSFPVASFAVFALLTMLFSGNLMTSIVQEGTVSTLDEDTGEGTWTHLDWFLVPTFQAALEVIESIQQISPIESLVAGRSIPIDQLAKLYLKLTLLIGIPIAGLGIYLFHRNELASSGKNG